MDKALKSTPISSFQVQKVVVVVAIILFAVKLIAYFLTHSVSILTDALESTVNLVAGFLGLYSLYLSAKPKDFDHPYGHGKVEFISAAIEGALIVVAGIMIAWESIDHLLTPTTIGKLDIGIYLISFAAILNYVLGTYCIKIGKQNNSLALVASGKHLQSDTYTTIGIIAGLIILYFTQIAWIDSAVAMVFGLLIIYTGVKIIRSSLAGIMDEADFAMINKLVELLNKRRTENMIDLHNLRIQKHGNALHVDCHVTLPWYWNLNQSHGEIDMLQDIIDQAFGESVELFVHIDPCQTFSCKVCSKNDCTERKNAFEKKIEWNIDLIVTNSKHQLEVATSTNLPS